MFIAIALILPRPSAAADTALTTKGQDPAPIVLHNVVDHKERRFVLNLVKDGIKYMTRYEWRSLPGDDGINEIYSGSSDLNDDGVPEVFLLIDAPGMCGSAGCQGVIMQRRGAHWHRACKFNGNEGEAFVRILQEKSNGYHRLVLCDSGSEHVVVFDGAGRCHDEPDIPPPHIIQADGKPWCAGLVTGLPAVR